MARPSPGVATTPLGTPGGGPGTTAADGVETLLPAALCAVTVNVAAVPGARPPTWAV